MVKIEYRSPSIDNERKMGFNKFELKTDEYLKVMWSTFCRYKIKGPLEVDATVGRSIDDIMQMLKRLESSINV